MRNQRMDLFKCVAIYSVVLLHIKTGVLDGQTAALTRFAVPYFFLVAGYFAYGQGEGKLLKRARHSLLLWAASAGLVAILCAGMVWRSGWSFVIYLQQQFTPRAWLELLAFQILPFPYGYHLWFIGALPLLYGLWWAVTRLCRQRERDIPCRLLAAGAVLLLGLHLFLGEGCAILGRRSVPPQYLRNAWMDGLPFFLLGAWMRFDEEWIVSRVTHTMVGGGLLLGGGAVLAEQRLAGDQDLFAGSVLFALLLLAAAMKWPEVKQGPVRRWMCRCGSTLTFLIYMVHVPLYSFFYEWRAVPIFGWVVEQHLVSAPVIALLSTGIALLIRTGKERLT